MTLSVSYELTRVYNLRLACRRAADGLSTAAMVKAQAQLRL